MELGSVMLSKMSQSEKDKYHIISLMWNLRNKTKRAKQKKSVCAKKQPLNCREQTDDYQREVGWGMGEIGDGA